MAVINLMFIVSLLNPQTIETDACLMALEAHQHAPDRQEVQCQQCHGLPCSIGCRATNARRRFGRRISRYAAGMTNIDNSGAVIMPPTIGEAMRRITSDPVPLPHMIGSSPAMITATVIAIGRTRSAAPSTIPAIRSLRLLSFPAVVRAVIA